MVSVVALTAVLLLSTFTGQASALACASSTAPSIDDGAATVQQAYSQWKADYIVPGDKNQVRVQRSAGDNYDTVSEGIGYGMLFAAYNNDQPTFDALWRYEQAHLNDHGVMNWQIAASGATTGWNGATDADEDMALALVTADSKWGGYTAAATNLISTIKKYEIEPGSNVVKPGDYWGGSTLMNPSYLAPSYYEVFADYTKDTSWSAVTAASYKVLDNIHNRSASLKTGLLPDWSTATGERAGSMAYDYGYDASRAPIRLALASAWSCNANANNLLAPFNATNQTWPLNNLASSYTLEGVTINKGDSTPLLAAAAAAATVSSSANYRQASWTALASAKTSNYFSDAMRMLGLLVASGRFSNPLQTAAVPVSKAPETTPAPTATQPAPTKPNVPANAKINIWWPSNGSAVSGTQPFKAMVDGMDANDYTMYWQVDGGQKNLMNTDLRDYPHKQSDVNVKGWNWRGSGLYKLTFTAVDASGTKIASGDTTITISQQ